MAWNGSGVFNRLYNWVSDAASSIKIRADRMDGEFDNYKAGLENCLTRDGQNSPSADIPWGTHKITGLATGTADTDAANLGNVRALQTEWKAEVNSVAYVAATQFKITGVSLAAIYNIANRRVRLNGTYQATIVSAVGGADTTVTVIMDSGNVPNPVTSVEYALLHSTASTADSLYLRSFIRARKNANVVLAVTTAQITGFTSESDFNTEHANGTITVKNNGLYDISVNLSLQTTNATNNAVFYIYKNGSVYEVIGRIDTGMIPTGVFPHLNWSAKLNLSAGDILTFFYQSGNAGLTLLGNAVADASTTFVSMTRIP